MNCPHHSCHDGPHGALAELLQQLKPPPGVAERVFPWCTQAFANARRTRRWSARSVEDLFPLLGSWSGAVAAGAAREMLWVRTNLPGTFREALTGLLQRPVAPVDKDRFLRALSQGRRSGGRVRAHFFHEGLYKTLPVEEIASWLEPETDTRSLVSTESLRVYVALVNPKGNESFRAAWLEIAPSDHVLIVSASLTGDDLLQAVSHELVDHLCQETLAMKSPDPTEIVPEAEHEEAYGFVFKQFQVLKDEKELAGLWARDHLRPSDGDGVVFDAGTSCLTAWKVIAKQIEDDTLSHLQIQTNNLLILLDWLKKRASVPILQTHVRIYGSELDPEHMAFYGTEEARATLMDTSFRPMLVYIGTSGIEFHGEEGILFGYHAGRPEREIKELLFQRPTETRVILATPNKIGRAGGQALNVLDIKGLDKRAPIFLVTTAPPGRAEKAIKDRFDRAKAIFKGKKIQSAIGDAGLDFHWIILDPENGDVPKVLEHLRAPDPAIVGPEPDQAAPPVP